MDIFNLIRAVRCREPIWNRQHHQYKDRESSLMLWTEVAQETGVDVETARCKWRGLRDTFRVQLRKLSQSMKHGTSNPLTWEYFDEMVFVKDQIYIDINRRKYSWPSNWDEVSPLRLDKVEYPMQKAIEMAIRLKMEDQVSSTEVGMEDGSKKYEEEEIEYKLPAHFCVAEVAEDTETRLELGKSETCEQVPPSDEEGSLGDCSSLALQKKLRALQDDNYCFLMSILPQLKTLPNKQKLFVRIKIQELLFSEILNMESRD